MSLNKPDRRQLREIWLPYGHVRTRVREHIQDNKKAYRRRHENGKVL